MNTRFIAGALSLLLTLSAAQSVSGCATRVQAADLMEGIAPAAVAADVDLNGSGADNLADFAVRLFKAGETAGENTLISPVSVLCALAMTANGAKGETLAQMEKTLGLSTDELNKYVHAYMQSLPSAESYKVSQANAIWFKDDGKLAVEKDFLQKNADYYGASIYKAAFDDATLQDINGWVKDKTAGMIDKVLDKIPEQAVMYLVNATAFDAEWADPYRENEVRDGTFTKEDGTVQNVKMMYGEEHRYLDDGRATGFVKYYADEKYAFAALLPNEGTALEDYLASLTGAGLMDTLKNARQATVDTGLPKFESTYEKELSETLQAMGMADAFKDNLADFTGLGTTPDGNIFISKVIHKTFIAVDEKGTRAGAVTAVEMATKAALVEQPKTVILDRPFVYMLIDCETNLPLFIGTVTDLG